MSDFQWSDYRQTHHGWVFFFLFPFSGHAHLTESSGFGLTVPCLTVLYSWWMTISLLLLGALWSKHLLAGKLPLLGVKFNKYIKAIQCVIGWLASEDNQFC